MDLDLDLGWFVLKPWVWRIYYKKQFSSKPGGWVFIIELYFMDGETVRESFTVVLLKWFY